MKEFKAGDTVRLTGARWGQSHYKNRGADIGSIQQIVKVVAGRAHFKCNQGGLLAIEPGFEAEPVEDESDLVENEEPEVANPISPSHYQGFSNGAEVIDITEHLTPNLANVVKYSCRAGSKTPDPMEDLLKARAYLNREINRLKGDPKW